MTARSLCLVAIALWGALGCSTEPAPAQLQVDAPPAVFHHLPPPPSDSAPACDEVEGTAWPRGAAGIPGLVRAQGGVLMQRMQGGADRELAFVGAHVFDLLDKLHREVGRDGERRRVVCAVLNDAAERGVKVLRLWGSLKRVGSTAEVRESARLLALVLDENARRRRPLRFIVTLLNHQAGYGAPDPTRSLDDQSPGPWHARSIYLEGAWNASGVGALGERIVTFGRTAELASPYVVGWELVNELDTFRHVAGGGFSGPEAEALRDRFIVPALRLLASALPQPILIGDIRGNREPYAAWAPGVLDALPAWLKKRLVWTTHVYAEQGRDPEELMGKLDVDRSIAKKHDMPFVLGELGEHVPGAKHAFCADGASHDLQPLLAAVERKGVRALLVWGEGRCGLLVDHARTMAIGVGSDSAEITAADHATVGLLRATRSRWPDPVTPPPRSGE